MVVGGVASGAWILTVLTIILAPVIFPSEIEEFVGRGAPRQYYSGLAGEILADYRGVQGIAHNSGNNLGTAREAERYSADVIEIDVLSVNGQLYASHDGPIPIIGSRVFPRPTLEQVWGETGSAAVILDLKEPSSGYRDRLLSFLDGRVGDRQVIVSSRNARTLEEFGRRQPGVTRLLSVSTSAKLGALRNDPDLVGLIDGVSIRHTVLDRDAVEWLKSHDLVVFAWVVNDLERVNELVDWGVDGITTDNLAILRLLGNGAPFDLPPFEGGRPDDGGAVAAKWAGHYA